MNYEEKDLIELFHLQNVPEAARKQMLGQFYQAVNTRVGVRVGESLTDEQLAEFQRLAEKNDDEAGEYLAKTVPNFESILESEIQQVVADIQKFMGAVNGDKQ